jgi:hypothetical protein
MKEKEERAQQNPKVPSTQYDELSTIWQELLGHRPSLAAQEDPDDNRQAVLSENSIPTLESDPWSTLLHAKGVENLDEARLQISPQEMEQMLQVMQEQSAQQDKEN